jgi:UPF0271 protein
MGLGVDLNADLGERDTVGALDAAMLATVTSASVACGVHAGTPAIMRATVELAASLGVAVGAHPGLPDREGMGRREMALEASQVDALVVSQVETLGELAASLGVRLQHVKPHGALYNIAARDRSVADAVAYAVRRVDPALILVGLSGSHLVEAGTQAGLRTASEVFADRAYQADGTLVPRRHAGAVLVDPDVVVARARQMIEDGVVMSVEGRPVPIVADTMCVHGDTPGAADLAARIRLALTGAGVVVRALRDA